MGLKHWSMTGAAADNYGIGLADETLEGAPVAYVRSVGEHGDAFGACVQAIAAMGIGYPTVPRFSRLEGDAVDYTPEVSDLRSAQKDLLWGMYIELRNHVRHAETMRSSAINIVLLVASALITVITLDKKIARDDLALSLIICFIGLFAALSSLSYVERYSRDRRRAEFIRNQLDYQFFERRSRSTLSLLQEDADSTHRGSSALFRWGERVTRNTHVFWLGLPLVVLAAGITLTVLALSGSA